MDNVASSPTQKLTTYLIELRKRLLYCFYFLSLVFCVLFYFSEWLFNVVAIPLTKQLPASTTMIATAVTGTFVAPMKLSFYMALFVSIPFLLYQLWAFLSPALYRQEKMMIWPLIIMSSLLFYCGIAFTYFFIFPIMFQFFVSIAPQSIAVMPDIDSFISFILKMFLAFGISFEVPVITFVLIKTGTVPIGTLTEKRPYFIVAAFIIGMLLTPPDVLSQIMLAIPLYLLFESGIFMARIFSPKESSLKIIENPRNEAK